MLICAKNNSRTTAIKAVAKANNLDIEYVEYDVMNRPSDYMKINPLLKCPSFQGSDGYILTEAIAIAIYSAFTPATLKPRCLACSLLLCI